jgi:hypothetical protein
MIKEILPYTAIAMFSLAYAVCILAYAVCISVLLSDKPTLSKKDCTIAEISPDFTVKEKELCRELRGKK